MSGSGFAVSALLLAALAGVAGARPGWTTGATGRGTARWTVEDDRLVYAGGADFGWAVQEGTLRDGFVEVRFKSVAGKQDRAGGVVWRWRDANTYYIARGNALEDNVVAYKMVNGRRTDLKPIGVPGRVYGVHVKVPSDTWHRLRVDVAGDEFRVTFNGSVLFRVQDGTLGEAGRVGVWSKADSVTEFAEFRSGE